MSPARQQTTNRQRPHQPENAPPPENARANNPNEKNANQPITKTNTAHQPRQRKENATRPENHQPPHPRQPPTNYAPMKTLPTKTPTSQSPLSKLPRAKYAHYPRKSERNNPRNKPLPRQPPKPANHTSATTTRQNHAPKPKRQQSQRKAPASQSLTKQSRTNSQSKSTHTANHQENAQTNEQHPISPRPKSTRQLPATTRTKKTRPSQTPLPKTSAPTINSTRATSANRHQKTDPANRSNKQPKTPALSAPQTLHFPRPHQPPGNSPANGQQSCAGYDHHDHARTKRANLDHTRKRPHDNSQPKPPRKHNQNTSQLSRDNPHQHARAQP